MFGRKAETPASHAERTAGELIERVKDSETVAKAQAKGVELAGKVMESDTLAKAQARGLELAELAKVKMKDAHLDERAAELAELARTKVKDAHLDERAAELAELARVKMKDAHLDERAADLVERARTMIQESETAQRAAERARLAGDQTLERLGAWLAESGAAERMGIEPARKRRFPGWLVLAAGAGAGIGYLVAKATGRQDTTEPFDDFAASAERLATTPPPAPTAADAPAGTANGGLDLADRIRSSLDADPRTAELSGLSINVAETTVFVRGNVPAGTEESTIREVIAQVPGVTDVDLQVITSA